LRKVERKLEISIIVAQRPRSLFDRLDDFPVGSSETTSLLLRNHFVTILIMKVTFDSKWKSATGSGPVERHGCERFSTNA
jgi:hypothetical protein